ncbi:3961_t:CDS:2 [Gigaspora margarita]|uniref:3961_t:CDS:1 n=1 Tax=Gigaspora margarita TaxID=4874 RepID=A0ABN7VBT9_GIGMA|nr:3961_t:CDS:2 [Gigaspora margarita]
MDNIKIINVSTTEEQNECYKIRTEVFVKEQKFDPANELDETLYLKSFLDILTKHLPLTFLHERYDESSSCHHFLALKSSLPIGTVRIHPYLSPTSTTGKIGRLSVLKQYRNMGVGELLLQTVESFAKSELRFERCILHSQNVIKEWYEKRGYVALGGIFIEEGVEHCKMSKDI